MSLLLALQGAGIDGNASGSVITVTASVISGVATGGATTGAQTVTGSVTIISGAATANAGAGGQTITATASVIPGAATGAATAGGQTVSGNVTIIAGAATGEAGASGALLIATASIIAGVATGEVVQALRGRGYSIDLGWRPHKANARNVIGWMIFEAKEEREPPVDIKVNFGPAHGFPRNILKPPVIDKAAVIARRKAQVLAIFEQSLQDDVAVVQKLLERA